MSGFPNIPTRTDFGPTMVSETDVPVTNDEVELGPDPVNLAFWQTAGIGRTVPKAVLLLDDDDAAVLMQALAWDPNAALNNVSSVRDSEGHFIVTFANSYADQRGQSIAFTPRAAIAMVQGDTVLAAVANIVGQAVHVYIRDASDTPTDADVLLMVW